MKNFETLSEREVLGLAISLEEEDERVYADFSEGLRQDYPATASVLDAMRAEESGHRRRLIELYRQKFGEHIPLIRRQDVRGFVQRKAVWLVHPLRLEEVRKQASAIEVETRRFYERAASRAQDASIRQLLDDLAQEERSHEYRPQTSLGARTYRRRHDNAGRNRTYVALPYSQFSIGPDDRGDCRSRRARHHYLGAPPLYGDTCPRGGDAGYPGRGAGVHYRDLDWQFVRAGMNSQAASAADIEDALPIGNRAFTTVPLPLE